jgi:hypothetical protein
VENQGLKSSRRSYKRVYILTSCLALGVTSVMMFQNFTHHEEPSRVSSAPIHREKKLRVSDELSSVLKSEEEAGAGVSSAVMSQWKILHSDKAKSLSSGFSLSMQNKIAQGGAVVFDPSSNLVGVLSGELTVYFKDEVSTSQFEEMCLALSSSHNLELKASYPDSRFAVFTLKSHSVSLASEFPLAVESLIKESSILRVEPVIELDSSEESEQGGG